VTVDKPETFLSAGHVRFLPCLVWFCSHYRQVTVAKQNLCQRL